MREIEPGEDCPDEPHRHVHVVSADRQSVSLPRALWQVLRTRGAWRIFRLELILAGTYLVATTSAAVITQRWAGLLTSIAFAILLLSIVTRSILAYRIGFAMGLEAFREAMRAPSKKRGAQIIVGSCELWDPRPIEVAHILDIDDLERHANGG